MLTSYSPKDVSVSFNGLAITGYAEDSFIRVRRNTDSLTEHVGAAGELALTKNADKTGEIEIELLQTSETHLALSALLSTYEFIEGAPIVVGELVINDPSGSAFVIAHNAYVKMTPEIELGSSQNSRIWTFGCETLVYTATPAGWTEGVKGFTL